MTVQTVLQTRPVESVTNSYDHVWVIIPALNEQASLPLVLSNLPSVGRVIVVDNASIDRTAQVAAAYGANVVSEPRRGYGSACLRGLQAISDRIEQGATPPEIVVFLDADSTDHGDQFPQLLTPIEDHQADFVLGSRLLGRRKSAAMPLKSVFGNRLACFLMRVLFGAQYTDLGPFRAIRYDALQKLQMVDRNFGWSVEMQIKATKAGLRTTEVPVTYRRLIGTGKISGTVRGTIQAGWKILYLITKYGWQTRGHRKVAY